MRPCSSVRRHLAHHAGREPRFYFEPWLIAELATVAAVWAAVGWAICLPGLIAGLALCHLQGALEHAGGTTSHYGFLYILIFFNDGYHVEHHLSPQAHWTELPLKRIDHARASRWPAISRALDWLNLDGLERWVLRSEWMKNVVLSMHEKAFRRLLPEIEPLRRIAVVGGGLFPRTALILQRLIPHAEIVVIDASREHIEIARAQMGANVEFRHEWYDPKRHHDFDLVIIPLAFRGDKKSVYRDYRAPALLVHDWIWRRGPRGVVVSPLLLKRLYLVRHERR
jgi:hypothetical protein